MRAQNLLLLMATALNVFERADASLLMPQLLARGGTPPSAYRRLPTDPKTPANPIVLIPGDGGSRLSANLTGKPSTVHYLCDRATADFFDLWLNLQSFVPIAIDCWVNEAAACSPTIGLQADNMKLEWNRTTRRSSNAAGVDVRIPFFGGTSGVEWLDSSKRSPGRYLEPIVDALVAWGYTRSKNVVSAPFDWRRAPTELTDYYTMLRTLIETVFRYNQQQKVIVLAHSMGNPIINYFYQKFVDQKWKDQFIHSHIAISPPWLGSMQIVKLFASGYNMDYYRVILPPSSLRPMQRSFTSSAFLFPLAQLWRNGESALLAITADRNYTLADARAFFTDIGYAIGYEQYETANGALLGAAPGVTMHCVYGHGVETAERLEWPKGYFPDYQPTITNGDGDGTVNRRSLEYCKHWRGANGDKPVTIHEVEGADHLGILADARTIQVIKDTIYNPPV